MAKKRPKRKSVSIDKIIEMLIDGKTFREIAMKLRIPLSTLHDFTSKAEHSARVREALIISADTYADMAAEVLRKARGTGVEIMRARELAQHYRWMAAKRYPKGYNDRLALTGGEGEPLMPSKVVYEIIETAETKAKS